MEHNYLKRFLLSFFVFFTFLFIGNDALHAQTCTSYPGFTPRLPGGNVKLRGDLTMIGNNIVSIKTGGSFNNPYTGTGQNNSQTMGYIDIDNDNSTFSSSSATLALPNPGCAKIKYAYLYWTAIYPYATGDANTVSNQDKNNIIGVGEDANPPSKPQATPGSTRQSDWKQVKFKMPGGAYIPLTADQIIWDGYLTSDPNYFASNGFGGCKDTPYVCIKDVTSQLAGLASLNGDYTVANVRASVGTRFSGNAAGWNLVVIYEDNTLTYTKYISIFDGYQPINSNGAPVTMNVSGFKTLPAPQPVNVTVGVAALEGDYNGGNGKDSFSIRSSSKPVTDPFFDISDTANPAKDFFNSTVSVGGKIVVSPNRNPASTNTLGFDLDLVTLANASNGVIGNGDTGATLQLQTGGDGYGVYLTTFAVDIIAPKITLTKKVFDIFGTEIAPGKAVTLGQTLDYNLSFQNTGNDNAKFFKISDVLPINTTFVSADVSGAPGVSYVYKAANGEVDFTIPDDLVKAGGAAYPIKIRVQVASSCENLKDACSDVVQNQAFSSYSGEINTDQINDKSVLGVIGCGVVQTGTSNFLADMGSCKFTRTEVLCLGSLTLKAANGYDTYTWTNSSNTVIGNTQSITVTTPGVYKVVSDDLPTTSPRCAGKTETITVVPYGSGTPNPIAPFADQNVTCPNQGGGGDLLSKILLCGASDSRLIHTAMSSFKSISWQKLDETSCAAVTIADCANTNPACVWNQVATGPDYTANTAGQYRMVVTYQNNCFEYFYFNVFKNVLNSSVTPKDIFCNTNGSITVNGVPSGYEFQLVDQTTNNVVVAYQPNPTFTIPVAGAYKVLIRQIGVTGGCVFTIPNIGITKRDLQINTIVTNKICNTLGSIRAQASNVNPQYYYSISGPITDSHGPLATNDYTFNNLNPGTYTITVKTDDGCQQTQDVVVGDDSTLKLTATVSQFITCKEGNIQMNPTGGKVPYSYAIYSYNGVLQPITPSSYQTSVIFDIPVGKDGDYVFQVVDSKNCIAYSNQVHIDFVPPAKYDSTFKNVTCFGNNNGQIIYTPNGPSNGYAVSFRLEDDNGNVLATNKTGVFTNLAPGNYKVFLMESKGGATCEFPTDFPITQPSAALTATAEILQPYICGTTGSIQVPGSGPGSATGGTSPYTYSINGTTFVASPVFTGLVNGTYKITVKDANGCTVVTNPIVFAPLNAPTDLGFSKTAVTCPNQKSDVTISNVTGGNSPFVYEIIAPAASAVNNGGNNQFNNLDPGTYTFKVTDAKNCSYQENFTINSITPITVIGTLVSNVKCLGEANGAVKFTVNGYTGTYNYQINSNPIVTGQTANTVSVTGGAGNYSITVTDPATNCSATTGVDVSAPPSLLSIEKNLSPITACNPNGGVLVKATGGWGGYQYKLLQPDNTSVGPQPSGIFNNLSQSGTYTIEVTDANGCLATDTFTLSAPAPLSANIDSINSQFCYDSTNANAVKLVVAASGGQIPYEYQINGGAWQANNTFTNLVPGNYTIQVKDAFGCTLTSPLQATIAQQLTLGVTLKDLDCTTSEITNTVSGGYGSLKYQVKIDGGSYADTTFPYTTSNPGTYQFLVTDAQKCTAESAVITINSIVMPGADTNVTDVSCNGGNDGSVTIVAKSGKAPYTYSFNGSSFSSTITYGGLQAGIAYPYKVKDSKGCIYDGSVTLGEPSKLTVSETVKPFGCNSSNTKQPATITIDQPITTGTGPYQYSFNNGATFSSNNVLTVNDNGNNQTFTYIVKDANGCPTAPKPITINKFNPVTDLTISGTKLFCVPAALTSSTVTVVPTPNISGLTYSITAPAGAVGNTSGQTSGVFTGLTDGTYTFKVTDNVGCSLPKSYTVDPLVQIKMTSTVLNNVLCNGANTGVIEYNVSQNVGAINITTPVGAGTTTQTGNKITVSNLPAGTYNLEVTDGTTGCTASANNVPVAQPAAIVLTTAVATHVHCNNDVSTITVTPATGGVGPYSYAAVVNGGAIPTTFSTSNILLVDTNSGTLLNWDVYVKDANGCVITVPLDVPPITNDPSPTVALPALATDQCTATGTLFSLTLLNGTGISPLTYSIDGTNFQSSPTFTVPAGTYTGTIKDANGCTAAASNAANVTVYPVLFASAKYDKDITCNADPLVADASVTITAMGGSANYEFSVSSDNGVNWIVMTSNNFKTSAAGTYTFKVKDLTTNCEFLINTPYKVTTAPTPVLTVANGLTPLCYGDETGSLTLTTTGGSSPYVYDVVLYKDNTYATTAILKDYGTQTSGLLGGDYYKITVKDARGCTDFKENVKIVQPKALDFKLKANPVTCDSSGAGTLKGSIEVQNVKGGTINYTYSLNNFNGYIPLPPSTVGDETAAPIYGGLDFGYYEVTIVDKNGCTLKQQIQVASPPGDIKILVDDATTDCTNGGVVNLEVSGAALSPGPFHFARYSNPIPVYDETKPDTDPANAAFKTGTGAGGVGIGPYATFDHLVQGVLYSFVVYDESTNCYYYQIADKPTLITSVITEVRIVTPVTCFAPPPSPPNHDGTVKFTVSAYGDATTIDYELFDAQTNTSAGQSGTLPVAPLVLLDGSPATATMTGLYKGSYYIVYTKHGILEEGCQSASIPFEIKESSTELTVTADVTKKDNCKQDAGEVSISAQGGTNEPAPAVDPQPEVFGYRYQLISGTDLTTSPALADWKDTNTFNVESGPWVAWVRDSYGCEKSVQVNVGLDPSPEITATVANVCAAEGNFAINVDLKVSGSPAVVQAGIPPYSIRINGGSYQPATLPFTFSNLSSGTYTIDLVDSNNCSGTQQTVTILKPLVASAGLVSDITCAVVNAQIKVVAQEGLAPYSYEYSNDNGGTWTSMPTNILNTPTAGNYIFRVTDAQLCPNIIATPVQVTTPLAIVPDPVIKTDISCNGLSDGTILVTATGGLPPFQYRLFNVTTNTVEVAYSTQNYFTGLSAGTYRVDIQDGKSCVEPVNITLSQPAVLSSGLNVTTDFKCGIGNTPLEAVVTASPSGGTGPYQYSFDGGVFRDSPAYAINAPVGTSPTVSVIVKDANGCTMPTAVSVTVPALHPPTDIVFAQDRPITCIDQNATITLTPVDADMPISASYQYQILAPTSVGPQAANNFPGLTPDDYLFRVTDEDGCVFEKSKNIAPVTNITVVGQLVNNVSCNGLTDGAVQFTVADFTGTYSYSINGGTPLTAQSGTTINLTGLGAGDQVIGVLDEVTGCTATNLTIPTTVSQPSAVSILPVSNINANCNIGAQVEVSGSGGTPGYTYAFVPSPSSLPVSGYTSNASAVLDPATDTSWDVYVKDSNGCPATAPLTITIAKDLAPTIDLPAALCFKGSPLTIDLSLGASIPVGPPTYIVNGSVQSGSLYTITTPDTYQLSIVDANGCPSNTVNYVVQPQLTLFADMTQDLTCQLDANIDLIATGGTGTINTYEVDIDGGGYNIIAGTPYITSNAGKYRFRVTDSQGCHAESQEVIVTPKTTPTFTYTKTDVSCFGGADGSILIIAADGIPPYQYSIDNGATYSTSPLITGLNDAGVYNVIVKDRKDCPSASTLVDITQPLDLAVTTSTNNFNCSTNNVVTITANPSGGTGPYLFSIDGSNYFDSQDFTVTDTGLIQDSITMYVKDAHGCENNSLVQPINPLPAISATVTQDTQITCTNSGEIVTINVTVDTIPGDTTDATVPGNPTDYNYQLLPSGVIQSGNPQFTLTDPGTYVFQVTDKTTGCSVLTQSYTVAPYNTIAATLTATKSVTCFEDSDGQVTLDITGYAGTYDVFDQNNTKIASGTAVANTNNTITISNLPAGNISLKVVETAAPFCSIVSNVVTIASPTETLILTANQTANVTCTDGQGVIVADATGGWGGYQFELIDNAAPTPPLQAYGSNNIFTGLSAGTYTVNLKDANGCVRTQTVPLNKPSFITASALAAATLLDCNGDTKGSISTSASGGQGTYLYSLNYYDAAGSAIVSTSGPQLSGTFNGLGAGIYSVTVSDDWNCDKETNTVTISEPTPILASLSQTSPLTCTPLSATLEVSATGGTGPYQFSADGSSYSSTTVYNVDAGTYHYFVQDAKGCISVASNDITIDSLLPLVVNLDKTDAMINCHDETTASITATAEGAVGNYQYRLFKYDASNNPVEFRAFQSTGYFTGLTAGKYYVSVQSGDCPEKQSADVDIVNPPLLEIINLPFLPTDVSCNGQKDGSVTVKTAGGTGVIQFAISPKLNQFFTSTTKDYTFKDLAAGNYDVLVQDAAGCFQLASVTIKEPAVLSVVTVPTSQICSDDPKGTVSITMTGGTAPYKANLSVVDFNLGTITPVTTATGITATHVFSNLDAGNYYIEIFDANNCTATDFTVLNPAVDLSGTKTNVTYSCPSNTPGNKITVTVDPALAAAVKYSINGTDYQDSNVFTDQPAGTYAIYVKHTNGCIRTFPATVIPTAPINVISVTATDATCNGSATGSLDIKANGGTSTLYYSISPNFEPGPLKKFDNLAAGTYQIKVQDAIGCEVAVSGTVKEPAAIVVTAATVVQELCTGDNNASISVNISGGTTPYLTSLDNVSFTSNTTYPNLTGGKTYTIYVKDANNCTPTVPFTYTLNPSVDLQLSLSAADSCTNNTPTQTITAKINSALTASDVKYSLDGTSYQTSNVFPNLTAGTYVVYAKHVNGCIKTQSITLVTKTPINASVSNISNVNCNGSATGSITVTTSGGTAPYQYAISPGFAYQSGNVFIGLMAGIYDIKVLDAVGCETTLSGNTVSEPPAFNVSLVSESQEICEGDSNASVEISVAGGTPPYYTSLNPNGDYQPIFKYDHLEGGQTYVIYIKDSNGCTTQFSKTFDAPIDINASYKVTYDCTAFTVNISVNASVKGNVSYSLDGQVFQSSNVFTNVSSGNHTVIVKHQNNLCTDSVSFKIAKIEPVSLVLKPSGLNEFTAVASGGTGNYTYTLNGADKGSENVFVIYKTGNYEVTATDTNGCSDTESIFMEFIDIEIPNNFTPNDDGLNDGWTPKNTQIYPNMTVGIFDRYGRKVAVLGVNDAWNGNYNGAPLPTGDYWYIIKLADADNREFVGHFTLYR